MSEINLHSQNIIVVYSYFRTKRSENSFPIDTLQGTIQDFEKVFQYTFMSFIFLQHSVSVDRDRDRDRKIIIYPYINMTIPPDRKNKASQTRRMFPTLSLIACGYLWVDTIILSFFSPLAFRIISL